MFLAGNVTKTDQSSGINIAPVIQQVQLVTKTVLDEHQKPLNNMVDKNIVTTGKTSSSWCSIIWNNKINNSIK